MLYLNHAWFKTMEGTGRIPSLYIGLRRFTNLYPIRRVKRHDEGSPPHLRQNVVKSMHIVTKTCSCCGNTFTTDIPRQTYCSVACLNTQNTRIKRQRKEACRTEIESMAAPKTVSAVRPTSLAFNVCGMRASYRLTQHPLLGRSRP